MIKGLLKWVGLASLMVMSALGEKIYNEVSGLVIMEMENTESPLSGWDFRAKDLSGYPAGAAGSGHLEYMRYGPDGWGVASSPLVYKFKINQGGVYRLFFRAHKRLNPGDAGDKHNDCFIRMEGDFDTGSADIPLSKLVVNSKLYGGDATVWGRATHMDLHDGNKPVYYLFKAGEVYTFVVSGRSNQFNLDRIVFSHESYGWVNNSIFENQAESPLYGGPFVDAGSDQVINLPNSQVTLPGSATDDGTVASYNWTQESGPNTAVLSGESTATLTASGLMQGTYVFRLSATDNDGNTASDEVTVDVINIQVIEFDSEDGFVNGELNGQVGWNAESSWTVNTNNNGSVSTTVLNNLAVLNAPVQLAEGETFSFSMDFEFSGSYAVPSGFVYAMLAGLKADASATSVSTGGHEPDVNVQLQNDGKYRLLNNYAVLSGASSISSGAPDGGDQLRLDYEITMGSTAADTTYTARLQNISDGTDTGTGTVSGYVNGGATYTGIDANVFSALSGSGAFMFVQRINPANHASGLDALQVNSIAITSTSADPVADAGADQVVNLPATQATLQGSGVAAGTITAWSWTQEDGPNAAVLSGQTTSNLTASGLVEGSYVFRLTVTDDKGLSGSDDVGVLVVDPTSGGDVAILGDQIIWHKVTLELDGPQSSETATPNPFADYRMDVTFTHGISGTTYTVPGYFAADGNAANSSAGSGNKWHCHFRPDEAGTWNYSVAFRYGNNVAMGAAGAGAVLPPYDGVGGSFSISSNNPATAPDLRSKGRLRYVGKHHLQFEGSGEYFLKFGPDSPENFLEYFEFDNTPEVGNKGNWKQFAAHSGHYNNDGELWQGTKGKNILGAVNFVSSTGANSISMLLNNIGRTVPDPNNAGKTLSAPGDGARCFPFLSTNVVDRLRYDCSKLAQWEMVFDHTEKKGLFLHFKLAETEMARDLDIDDPNAGLIGNERKLYYREMVARFGHHLALNWNISEEIPVGSSERTAWLQHLETIDPWQNHRVFHTGPSEDKGNFYNPHLGASEQTGVSLQTPNATTAHWVFDETKQWIDASAGAGQPWVVGCDEQGPGNVGVGGVFDLARKYVLWGNVMAGGSGAEYYWGGRDLSMDTYVDFEALLITSDYCVNEFFYGQRIPFWNMSNADTLLSGNAMAHCLADAEGTYVVYLAEGGTASLDLSGQVGSFDVRWFDPRNGGTMQVGSVAGVTGGGVVALGNAPSASTDDWAILVRKDQGGGQELTVSEVYPEADSYGLDANHATQPGSWNKLHIMGDSSKRDSYFRFDVSNLDGAEVEQVFFRIKVASHYQPQTPTAFIQTVADDAWVETELCWTNVPAAGDTQDSGIVPEADGWLVLDVTDYILVQAAGDGKASMQLTTTSEHLINLHSREAAEEGDRPHLAVYINVPNAGYAGFEKDHLLVGGQMGDDDGDGRLNIYEYGLGGNPTNANDMGYDPVWTYGTGDIVSYSHVLKTGADVEYVVEYTTNLAGGIWQDNGWTTSVTNPHASEGFDERTVELFAGGMTNGYFRLRIVQP